MREFLTKGNVYVHCEYGVSRSTTLVLAMFILHLGKRFEFSMNFVRNKRPIVSPDTRFISNLKEIDAKLANEKSAE